MSETYRELVMPAQPDRDGLSFVSEGNVRTGGGGLPRKIVQCSSCLQHTEYTDGHDYCGMCGAGLSSLSVESLCSAREPGLITGHESYSITPPVRNEYPSIPCRNVRACIKTAQGSSVIVDLINISRGGVSFTSPAEFSAGTLVSIATHYLEGGHNIYQDGQIIRVQREDSSTQPGEYAIEFLLKPRLSSMTVPIPRARV